MAKKKSKLVSHGHSDDGGFHHGELIADTLALTTTKGQRGQIGRYCCGVEAHGTLVGIVASPTDHLGILNSMGLGDGRVSGRWTPHQIGIVSFFRALVVVCLFVCLFGRSINQSKEVSRCQLGLGRCRCSRLKGAGGTKDGRFDRGQNRRM